MFKTNPIYVSFPIETEDAEKYNVTFNKVPGDLMYELYGEYDDLMNFMTKSWAMSPPEADMEIIEDADHPHYTPEPERSERLAAGVDDDGDDDSDFPSNTPDWDTLSARTTASGRQFESLGPRGMPGERLEMVLGDLSDGLPEDYEECGYCGFDHSYEPEAAYAWHTENDPNNEIYEAFEWPPKIGSHLNVKRATKAKTTKIPLEFGDNEFGTKEYGFIPRKLNPGDPEGAASSEDSRYLKHIRSTVGKPAKIVRDELWIEESVLKEAKNPPDLAIIKAHEDAGRVDIDISALPKGIQYQVIDMIVDKLERAAYVQDEHNGHVTVSNFRYPGDVEISVEVSYDIEDLLKAAGYTNTRIVMPKGNDYDFGARVMGKAPKKQKNNPEPADQGVKYEGFDKFIDKILLQESHDANRRLIVEKDSPMRIRAARHQERPAGRIIFKRGQ